MATKTKAKAKASKAKSGGKPGAATDQKKAAAKPKTSTPKAARPRVRPLGDRLVVRLDDPEVMTASGLVIPDTAQDKPQRGTVLAVGPGRRSERTGERLPMTVAEGDAVMFAKFAGTEITVDGQELMILAASDVLAVIG